MDHASTIERMEAEDVLASGDKVVARVRATGTHREEL